MRKPYPTDLSDAEWNYLEPHLVAVDWQTLLPPKGFQVLPRRWVVERTIAWIGHNRRMSKDYERLCASGEAFVYAAMIRLMTRRLVRV
jgi:transposase